jgi:hypothetical protein
MGFNRDFSGNGNPEPVTRTQDDGKVGRISLGLDRPDGGLKRAATVGAGTFKTPTTASTSKASAAASSSKAANGNEPVQKTLTMFMSSKGAGSLKAGNPPIMRATGRPGVGNNNKTSIFGGVGGGVRRTISKRTPLPMVLGSPVKGGQGADAMVDENEVGEAARTSVTEEASDNNSMASANISTATVLVDDSAPTEGSGKGKLKETRPDASRRLSSLSYALSRSVNALPSANPPTKGLMGPPATPPSIGNRSTGSNASGASSASPSQAGPSGATRSSARIAKSAPALTKTKAGTDGHASSSNKGAADASAPTPSPETRKILDGCVIFVDVKTEDGDEAGSVFVKMLEDLGARVSLKYYFSFARPLSEISLFF